MSRPLVATLFAGLLALAGCVHVHEHDHHQARRGPPPHAPAHGYRHPHHDVDLRYDVHLGVYVVIGHPHHFFHDGRYYRRAGSGWERCSRWKKAHWKPVEVVGVPVALAKHYQMKKHKVGKHGHGHGPAKHGE